MPRTAKEVYTELKRELEYAMRTDAGAYATIRRHLPEEGELLDRVLKGDEALKPSELQRLVEFGTSAAANGMPGSVASDYDRIIKPLVVELKNFPVTYTQAEDKAAEALNQFFKKHEKALNDLRQSHPRFNNPKMGGLERVLESAEMLDSKPSFGRFGAYSFSTGNVNFKTDKEKLRDGLVKAISARNADTQRPFGPLANGVKMLQDAEEVIKDKGKPSEKTAIAAAIADYKSMIGTGPTNKLTLAKEAVAKILPPQKGKP